MCCWSLSSLGGWWWWKEEWRMVLMFVERRRRRRQRVVGVAWLLSLQRVSEVARAPSRNFTTTVEETSGLQ